jgi:hypothetical protein
LEKAACACSASLEHGRDARLLASRQAAGGECPLGTTATPLAAGVLVVDELLRQVLVHRDVTRKKFRRVTEFLGLDAQSMPPLRIQSIQVLAPFHNCLQPAAQLFRCRGRKGPLPRLSHLRGNHINKTKSLRCHPTVIVSSQNHNAPSHTRRA